MTPLQQAELEILVEFITVCEKLGLKYYLLCGSALGAVKYNGFIPWDDDIDVGMPRPDYERFCNEAGPLLPRNIFLQNYKTDPRFPTIYSKLRNSDTTYIEKSSSRLDINHGIYIDVFPLDGYPSDPKTARVFELRKTIYKRILSVAYLPNRKWKWIFIAPFRLIGFHKRSASIARRYERMLTKYPFESSQIIANHGNWQGKLDYLPKSDFGDGTLKMFEGEKVYVPLEFDKYLRRKYGDYTQDPPLSKQQGHHYYTVLDTDKSFREYIK